MQTYTAQVTPFLVHRFGSAATAQLGYSFQYSQQNWAAFGNSGPDSVGRKLHRASRLRRAAQRRGPRPPGAAGARRRHLVRRRRHLRRRSPASSPRSRRATPSCGASPCSARSATRTSEYAGTNPLSIEDAIWSVGLRLTPRPDSIIIVRYGRPQRLQLVHPECGRGARRAHRTLRHLQRHSRHVADPGPGPARNHHHRCARQPGGQPVRCAGRADQPVPRPVRHALPHAHRHGVAAPSLAARHVHPVRHLAGQEPVTSASSAMPVSPNHGVYATFGWAHEFSPAPPGWRRCNMGTSTGQLASATRLQGNAERPDTYALAATLMHRLSDKLTASMQVAWTGDTAR